MAMANPKQHATTGKCWCGYICGKLPAKQDDDQQPLYSRTYMKAK